MASMNPLQGKVGSQDNRRLARDDEGSALIEMAVTLPVLFILIFCFMEMCLAFYSRNLISELAREGTRYAMVRSSTCTTDPGKVSCTASQAQVKSYVSAIGLPNIAGGTITPAVTYLSSNTVGNSVQVTVTYVFKITMPLVPTKSITMTSTSVMPIIQ